MRRTPLFVVWGGPFGGRGGIETHVLRWCLEFARKQWRIVLVVSAPRSALPRLQELRARGVECVNVGSGTLMKVLRAAKLALQLRGRSIVFYSNAPRRLGPLMGRLLKPRVWVHHHHINYEAGDLEGWTRAERQMMGTADHIIVCSPVHAERMAGDVARDKVVFLPYLKNEGALTLPSLRSRSVVGFIGLLRRCKGVPVLLSLAPWFSHQGWRLELWGRDAEGVLRGDAPAGVQWHGEYDPELDLDRILSGVGCIGVPSLEGEGLPIVISEALSRGIPVACYAFAGVRWLAGMHPGLEVVNPSAEELKSALMRLMERSADTEFRRTLREAYLARLGNEACTEWWERLADSAKVSGH